MFRHMLTKKAALSGYQFFRPPTQMSLQMRQMVQSSLLPTAGLVRFNQCQFSTSNDEGKGGEGGGSPDMNVMDSFANAPSKQGSTLFQKNIIKKQRLQSKIEKDQQPRRKKSIFTGKRPQQQLHNTDEIILSEAYISRFGVEKSELLKQWLVLDKTEIQKQCEAVGIEITDVGDSSTSSQFMQQVFTYLSKFDAEEITRAKQQGSSYGKEPKNSMTMEGTSGGQEMNQSKFKDRNTGRYTGMSERRGGSNKVQGFGDKAKQLEMGKMLDQANTGVQETLNQMLSKHKLKEKVQSQKLMKAQTSEMNESLTEELILISGDEARDHRNLVDYPTGPMRTLKSAPRYQLMPSSKHQNQSGMNFGKIKSIVGVTTIQNKSEHDEATEAAAAQVSPLQDQQVQMTNTFEELESHDTITALNLTLTGVSIEDRLLIQKTMQLFKDRNLANNPNMMFSKLNKQVVIQQDSSRHLESAEFKELLSFANEHVERLKPVNKEQVVSYLNLIDSTMPKWLSGPTSETKTIYNTVRLALETQTSIPNVLKLCKNTEFLTERITSSAGVLQPQESQQIADIVYSMIKIAKQDYQSQAPQEHFEETIANVQGKIEQIQEVIMSTEGQKSGIVTPSMQKLEPHQLFTRVILFPTPYPGSKLEKLLAESLKMLIKADQATENNLKGLFDPHERNYILARGMQVTSDKELQNDMRINMCDDKGTGAHLTVGDSLNTLYILSGNIKKDSDLNNVHYLAGLTPPGIADQMAAFRSHDALFQVDAAIPAQTFQSIRKQLFSTKTRSDFREVLSLIEFVSQNSPMSLWRGPNQVRPLIQNFAKQANHFQFELNDLIRIQNIMLVSLQNPTYLFEDILAHKDSLATAVKKPQLKTFIENIVARMLQHQVQFDHLTNSSSHIHRVFLPYTEDTFRVLSKIITELVAEGESSIPVENFALINKILSLEQVTTKVFDTSDRAVEVLGKYLGQQLDHLREQSAAKGDTKLPLNNIQAQKDYLETQDAVFKSLRAVKPLVASQPQLVDTIAASIEVALTNLMQDLDKFTVTAGESELLKSTFTKDVFPLDELISTNKSILDAIASMDDTRRKAMMQKYLEQTPVPKIVDFTLRSYLEETSPEEVPGFFQSAEASKLVKEAIKQHTWGKIERLSGPIITYFNQVLDAEVLDASHKTEFQNLAEKFLLKIRNSRSLFGVDLARYFKLIKQLQEKNEVIGGDPRIFDKLIMNVSCNLRTLSVNLLFQFERDSDEVSIMKDTLFKGENQERFEKDRQYKRMIFQMYKDVFEARPELFGVDGGYGLSPLSMIFAELFDEMSFEDRKDCLSMLGCYSVDNYTEEFIQKLYDAFSHQHQIEELLHDDCDKFISLADKWPKFLQNNVLLTELTTINSSAFSIEDQSRVLRIQTHKNLLNPHFIETHFNHFIRLDQKEEVKKYLTNFLESIAYVGYTDNVSMEQITQVLRRIYKEPQNLGTKQLLDYLVVLAVSNSRYNDFDIKSRDFVEKALDQIERQFTGTKQLVAQRDNTAAGGRAEEFDLFLFNQIPSTKKSYNKILDKNTLGFESNLMKDGRKEYFQNAEKAIQNRFEKAVEEEDLIVAPLGVQEAGPKGGEDGTFRGKRVYDRGAQDMNSSFDEQHYFKQRMQKLAQLAKKDNHLLLYSNVNTLDFVDINSSPVAQAWTILFHFRGKSIESMLFEEFNSIAQRNTISKTKNHEVFNKMYLELNAECYKQNLQLEMAGSCERTGWPIDLTISNFLFKPYSKKSDDTSKNEEGAAEVDIEKQDQQYAVYFLLQEEICYNAKSRREEPLGLQKLMMRHLSQISNFKVCTVNENEATNNIDSAIAKIQDEFYPVLSTPRRNVKKQEDTVVEPVEEKPFNLTDQDDFISEEEIDDIVDMPQSML